MYTTIIHPLRKALNLSCNEYCIMDSIYNLSNNSKYGGWCMASNSRIAKELDLSVRTIISTKKALQSKGLIEVDEKGNSRPSPNLRQLMQNKSNWAIASVTDNELLASIPNFTGYAETSQGYESSAQLGYAKTAHNNKSTFNNKRNINNKEVFSFDDFIKIFGTLNGCTEAQARKRHSKLNQSELQTLKESTKDYIKLLSIHTWRNKVSADQFLNPKGKTNFKINFSEMLSDKKPTPSASAFHYYIGQSEKKHNDQQRWERDKKNYTNHGYKEISVAL